MRRLGTVTAVTIAVLLVGTPAALACGFLVAPNGTIQLVKTTTLAAYHYGVEHYVTSFEYAGGETDFGSIIPLPGVPTAVERAGDWTLQRLVREVEPPVGRDLIAISAAQSAYAGVEVILETQIDALDITVLRGGGTEVVAWANQHGYLLPDDASEVLEFYSRRSPIFLAARFDASRARELGQNTGDGTPIQVTIETDNPWVPLRILSMGKVGGETVEADIFLLTDRRPTILQLPFGGLSVERSEPASTALLDDLRSDEGTSWVPTQAWFSYVKLNQRADRLGYDLAIDASGRGDPSPLDAGIEFRPESRVVPDVSGWVYLPIAVIAAGALGLVVVGPMLSED